MKRPVGRAGGAWLMGAIGFCVLILTVVLGSGCHIVQSTAELPTKAFHAVTPGSSSQAASSPQELEDKLMRFADSFSGGMVNALAGLRRGTNPVPTQEVIHLQVTFLSDTTAIATGPNALANLLDMTVLVTLSRMTIENYWVPRRGEEQMKPLLTICKQSESEIWQMAGTVLTHPQQTDLQEAINAWYNKNSGANRIFYMRAIGLASEVQKASKTPASSSTSVFTLLGIDPLSGLDPATREIAETRMAIERAMYIAQHMPQIVSLQSQLLTMELLSLPEVTQVVSNTTVISASVSRLSGVAEDLPQRLEADQARLKDLLAQSQQTLDSGRQMSDSLNTTLKTFDGLMKRFGVGETNSSPPSTNSHPFNILDYAQTADQLALASKQLESLLGAFNNTLDSTAWNQRLQDLNTVSRQTKKDADDVLNHAFFLGAMLIASGFVCALIYRIIAVKLIKTSR